MATDPAAGASTTAAAAIAATTSGTVGKPLEMVSASELVLSGETRLTVDGLVKMLHPQVSP
jgi:hypothetical protein